MHSQTAITDPTNKSSPTNGTTDPLLERNEIIITAVAGGAVLIIGAVLIMIITVSCCRKTSHKVQKRSRSSIYLTAQGSMFNSAYNGMVHLHSHQRTPYIDFNPIHQKPREINGNSVRFSAIDHNHDDQVLKM